MAKPPLPEGLLKQRPGIDQESENHPAQGIGAGKPPIRLTKAVHDRIVELVLDGNHPRVAAQAAGITGALFSDWMRRGRAGDPHLYEFAEAVDKAEADAEIHAVKTVRTAAIEDPEFAKWWLERSKSRWAKSVTHIVQNEVESIVEKLREGLPPDLFAKVLGIICGEVGADVSNAEPQ